MKIFVNTDGHKGRILAAREVIKPDNKQVHVPTDWVICSPYRRVYRDESGLYVVWNKRKAPVYQVT